MFKIADANLAISRLNFQKQYTAAEWDLIRLGSIPASMDDKWIILEEHGCVYFVRSWTGRLAYKVEFTVGPDGAKARSAMANIRPAEIDDAWRTYYARMLEWLIGYWLLGHDWTDFPKAPAYHVPPRIELVRDPLPFVAGVDAVAYGAKDTGAMGGGAAAAILAAAGEELVREARRKLAGTSRRIGDAVVTDSFGLAKSGIMQVCHIVSIMTNTPQGDWCPHPDKLYDGVKLGLEQLARDNAGTVAMSALATGEGRVKPADAAKFMLSAIRDHQLGQGKKVHVVLSLPAYEDYEAFEALSSRF